MLKGSIVCILDNTPVYSQPVGVTDQLGAIMHHAGLAIKGQNALVLSNPADWEATPHLGFSNPWTQILLGGQVVWVKNHYIGVIVQPDDGVVY